MLPKESNLPPLPKIESALINIVGVFTPEKDSLQKFTKAGYMQMPYYEARGLSEEDLKKTAKETRNFYADKYYREYRKMMLAGDNEAPPKVQSLLREKSDAIITKFGLNFQCCRQELYLFEEDVAIFSIRLKPKILDFENISNLINWARNFDSKDISDETFHAWISREVLCGIPLRGKKSQSDLFSGSKFKVYSVVSTQNREEGMYSRDFLLYELGTSSKIHTMATKDYFTPSESYYEEIMKNKVEAFANYSGLALLDSFTVIGEGIWNENPEPYSFQAYNRFSTYAKVYFSIYLFNLYFRFNIFRSNTFFLDDPVKERDRINDFLNRYNFYQISFDFLPNMFFASMKNALGIEKEIQHYSERLEKLAANIQEEQERRQAFLLTFISLITTISNYDSVFTAIDNFRERVKMDITSFYIAFSFLAILIAIPTLAFLFPHHTQKLKKYWMQKRHTA